MNYYTPKRLRWGAAIASVIRGIAELIKRWPLVVIAAFIISPIGPHLRFEYTYEERGSYRHMIHCEYLGSRGFVKIAANGECPVLRVIDRRKP